MSETTVTRSMRSHQPQNSREVSWVTPRWIMDALGEFDLDPCVPDAMPWITAPTSYTELDDGLQLPWFGRVWLNPPFDRERRSAFLEKMAIHQNGIALIPASTETDWFKRWIWPFAKAILFLDRRPHFHYPDGRRAKANSGCSICLVAYTQHDSKVLKDSGIGFWVPVYRGESL